MADYNSSYTGAQIDNAVGKATKLPVVSSADEGKVLQVDSNGNIITASSSSGGTSIIGADSAQLIPYIKLGEVVALVSDYPFPRLEVTQYGNKINTVKQTYFSVSSVNVLCIGVKLTDNSILGGLTWAMPHNTNGIKEAYNCIMGYATGSTTQLTSGTAYYFDGQQVPLNTDLPEHKPFLFASDCVFYDND